jgi:SulP family sulfate permease
VTPGVVVYRLDDRLFFANASYVRGRVHEALRGASTVTTALVLDAEAITHIDSAGLHALEDLALGKDGNRAALRPCQVPDPTGSPSV